MHFATKVILLIGLVVAIHAADPSPAADQHEVETPIQKGADLAKKPMKARALEDAKDLSKGSDSGAKIEDTKDKVRRPREDTVGQGMNKEMDLNVARKPRQLQRLVNIQQGRPM